jgi:hypothetical protein
MNMVTCFTPLTLTLSPIGGEGVLPGVFIYSLSPNGGEGQGEGELNLLPRP